MDRHLCQHAWLAAGRYTIADIALYAYTHCADEAGFEVTGYKGVMQWLARVRERPRHVGLMEETSAVPPQFFSSVY
jgi:glutathione S-transferase